MTTVLLTGGTGTFGRAFLERVLPLGWVVRVFSRDELKQGEVRREFADWAGQLRFFVGDVRDTARVARGVDGVDAVVHAAALKQVVSCEYNPEEAIKTNVLGTRNVVEASLAAGVPRSVFLSSDKAVHPINVYGSTKLCAEKLWLSPEHGGRLERFAVVRYGNVRGSRGSFGDAIRRYQERYEELLRPSLRVTDPAATRFWMDPSDAVDLVLTALREMRGGEVFVPKVGSSTVGSLVPSGAVVDEVGLQLGEKKDERLLRDDEIPRTFDCGSYYVVADEAPEGGERVPDGFEYSSAA